MLYTMHESKFQSHQVEKPKDCLIWSALPTLFTDLLESTDDRCFLSWQVQEQSAGCGAGRINTPASTELKLCSFTVHPHRSLLPELTLGSEDSRKECPWSSAWITDSYTPTFKRLRRFCPSPRTASTFNTWKSFENYRFSSPFCTSSSKLGTKKNCSPARSDVVDKVGADRVYESWVEKLTYSSKMSFL